MVQRAKKNIKQYMFFNNVRILIISSLAAALLLLSFVPNVFAQSSPSSMSSVSFISYTNPLVAGGTGSVTVLLVTDTVMDLHIDFKAHSTLADWTYSSDVESISSVGLRQVAGKVNVPFQTEVAPVLYFYYCAWITPRGQSWTSHTQAVSTPSILIIPPPHVTHDESATLLSQVKHEVVTSHLHGVIKSSLLHKLDTATKLVDSAFVSGNLDQLDHPVSYLNDFINQLNSNPNVSSYPDSSLWINQAIFIIGRLELATR